MSTRTPRHRAPQSAQARRAERQVVLALIASPILLALLIWFAVRTDNVVLLIVSVIGAVIGTWIGDKRKARKKANAGGN
ncbi:hypothetical protein [Kocuria rosea]|uniref:Uncharacterized protein n=1 Tax=Kocuria rosea TaxID=1275 RepID=A0A4R5YT04_KOCRO|nr:hypothetical protein [Kocuria rosea]TDL46507.1 hypothetical protein E2R59_00330 [Kocuria rosea]